MLLLTLCFIRYIAIPKSTTIPVSIVGNGTIDEEEGNISLRKEPRLWDEDHVLFQNFIS